MLANLRRLEQVMAALAREGWLLPDPNSGATFSFDHSEVSPYPRARQPRVTFRQLGISRIGWSSRIAAAAEMEEVGDAVTQTSTRNSR